MKILRAILFSLLFFLSASLAHGQGDVTVYGDALQAGWENWSWNSTINFAATNIVQSGSNATSVTLNAAWAGVYLRLTGGALSSGYDRVRFWINSGPTGGQQIGFYFVDSASNPTEGQILNLTANTWTQVEVSLAAFGSSSGLYGLEWQDHEGTAQPTFYLDNIQLLSSGVPPTPPPVGSGPALQVDANAAQHAIDPNIYGLNFADPALAADIRLPVNRWGGNSTTRYNWQNDTSNHASDWYFENIPNDNPNPGNLPNGSASDQFISDNLSTNTQTLLTIPMIGWTPKSRTAPGDPYDCGFSVAKYGPQQYVDSPFHSNCGNGKVDDTTFITGNDPTDTSMAITPAFVQAWMAHVAGQFGASAVHYYNLDNEPSIWHETHRDVFPIGLHNEDLRDRTYAYAAAIKATDPSALTLGPVEYGWTGYFYSGYDQSQPGNWWENPDDYNNHQDHKPLVQWYLEQMKAYEQNPLHPKRILDYLDLHYYPSADGVTLLPAGDVATQALRLRTTRSLWDPTYIDESWIGYPSQAIREVRLIPRMHDWVNTYYPGTKLAISEYNFGGLEDINGALTQADVLGIFGREGLDLATLWNPPEVSDPPPPPQVTQPFAYAFRMYRNYDGTGSGFGETSVSATSGDQSQLSIYAAKRADGALTLMIINKTAGTLTSSLNVSNFNGSTVNVYRYSTANLNQIVHLPNLALSAGSLSASYPANSITLLVVNSGDAANAKPTINYFTTPTPTLTWTPISWAVRYDVEIASDNGFSQNMQTGGVTPNFLSYQAKTLTPGTWYWHVRAVKTLAPLSVGGWSATQTFVVAPP